MWRYATNIIWQLFAKRGNLDPWKSFLVMQCSLINHSTNLSNLLVELGSSWEVCGSLGVNIMIWFEMLVSGLWKRRTKWCPYLTMGDWSGKQLFMTWKNSICCRMFLTYLTWYGVSKVSLLLVAICWLLGRLDPKWAILLKFPTVLCWFSRGDLYILSFPFDFFFNLCLYIYIYCEYHNLQKHEIYCWIHFVGNYCLGAFTVGVLLLGQRT